MSDRTSAAIFGEIFDLLADNPDERNKAIARKIWGKIGEYDFSPYQMGSDRALLRLGIAKMGIHPRYPDDGEIVLYGDE